MFCITFQIKSIPHQITRFSQGRRLDFENVVVKVYLILDLWVQILCIRWISLKTVGAITPTHLKTVGVFGPNTPTRTIPLLVTTNV